MKKKFTSNTFTVYHTSTHISTGSLSVGGRGGEGIANSLPPLLQECFGGGKGGNWHKYDLYTKCLAFS